MPTTVRPHAGDARSPRPGIFAGLPGGGLPTADFLRAYWQKKPLLVRGAFPAFADPISPDELAGLACEDGVESRIVREKGGSRPWEVTYGPHAESAFEGLPDRGWTLLVQEVNRHVPEVAALLEPFAFVPNVRVDDVMISFAAPGGSVGPHLDSYDVFLIQGQGRRRWKYGAAKAKDVAIRPGLDLRILARPVFDHDEVLEAGDMLYIPPGFTHHGVAETPCLTYSVGFRAPNAGEMWSSFIAWAAKESPDAKALLVDPPLLPANEDGRDPGAIPEALLARVRQVLRRGVAMAKDDRAVARWFASFATELSPGHALEAPSRAPKHDAVADGLAANRAVVRSEEGRWAHLPAAGKSPAALYVAGLELVYPPSCAKIVRTLCAQRRFEGKTLLARDAAGKAFIARLFALGALRFGRAPRRGAAPSAR